VPAVDTPFEIIQPSSLVIKFFILTHFNVFFQNEWFPWRSDAASQGCIFNGNMIRRGLGLQHLLFPIVWFALLILPKKFIFRSGYFYGKYVFIPTTPFPYK
jgi:hypothetical protein